MLVFKQLYEYQAESCYYFHTLQLDGLEMMLSHQSLASMIHIITSPDAYVTYVNHNSLFLEITIPTHTGLIWVVFHLKQVK